jgi:Zn-dependent peptidase ImmA (M78 family)/predicted secreted protein
MDRQQLVVLAMGAAHRAHREFDVDPRSRVDVFGALRLAGAYVFFRPLKSMCGAYLPSGDNLPALLINSNLPLSVQRYTAAHELGHVFLKHKTLSLDTEDGFVPETRSGTDEDEVVAEAFAAFFLMPKPLVVNSIKELGVQVEHIAPRDVYLLSLRMGTSFKATINQLQTLKIIRWPLAEKLRALTPKEIKQELNDEEALGRHDIWLLDEHWNGKRIYPTPMDTIRIQLSEIPTSGYTWLPGEQVSGVQLIEDRYREDGREEMIGGSRLHEFVARVQEDAQNSRLTLEKRRPWEKAASRMEFSVEIRPQQYRQTGPLDLPKLA